MDLFMVSDFQLTFDFQKKKHALSLKIKSCFFFFFAFKFQDREKKKIWAEILWEAPVIFHLPSYTMEDQILQLKVHSGERVSFKFNNFLHVFTILCCFCLN